MARIRLRAPGAPNVPNFAVAATFILLLTLARVIAAQAPVPTAVPLPQISEADAREWLTYLSSDLLEGREVFTEGYGLAAGYIAEHLRQWGLKPLGDLGSYFQVVRERTYRVTQNSSVTVEVNGQTRTFKQGDHIAFSVPAGGRQTLTFTGAEFAGYGLVGPGGRAEPEDFDGRDVKGKLVIFMPGMPRRSGAGPLARQGSAERASAIIQSLGAGAALSFGSFGSGRPATDTPIAPLELTTVQRVDGVGPPFLKADETFYDFLFGASPIRFPDLALKAARGEPLSAVTLSNVKVTLRVDDTYQVVSTRLTRNVVGMIEGADASLKDTYVFFGAHLDHVGYSQSGEAKGRVNTPVEKDPIWNGADDDGTGTTALLAIAKAFATGPKPKRSVVVVWHAGEEAGLLGSLYMADFPVVPLDKVQVQLNIDMIGRNRDNDPAQGDTLFVIGDDRISTDLHNLIVDTNRTAQRPLRLDYEYNDPNDPNDFYTRSDHYSYAAKGIPIAFFFTGTHPDYHANTDTVDRILFPKLVRIAQMVYRTGFSIADSAGSLERDNRGPRAGKGFQGSLSR